jgi:peptide/nickel transport system ATP-binding protein
MTITSSEREKGTLAATGISSKASAPLLEVDGLRTYFDLRHGIVKAVDGVSFSLGPHETLAIVGESGCGKSITALSLMRLVPDPPGRIAGGSVKLAGVDLLTLEDEAMRGVRGKDIAMIFQEPMTSLNPVLTIGSQIAEVLLLHEPISRQQAWDKSIDMLRLARIPEPEQRAKEYPHQLSGGMRQRAMIAMALACNPKVLIADEPTTALDVTIQAQILDIILDLQRKLGTAIILITHDLGVVAETAQRVIVMYAGRKVEEASVDELFARPQHTLYARADGLHPASWAYARRGGRRGRPTAGNPRHGSGIDQPAGGLRIRAALRPCRGPLPPRLSRLRGETAGTLGRMLAFRRTFR